MQLSNAFSDACVAVSSLFVFVHFFSRIPFNNRLLWGTFFAITAIAATTGVCRFLGMNQLKPLHESLTLLAGTAGVIALLAGIWVNVSQTTASKTLLISSLTLGLLIFIILLDPALKPFKEVIPALGMLIGMLFAVWGLMRKYKKAIWIIAGIMIVGIATKVMGKHIPFDPTDVYHYALVAMVWCFGKSV